ncbi:MAG: alanine--tRNA ligase [Clostridiales Family XIII bacterium]|jgi:alanyl-tRNA synthetase|nr:alanine--tRNA ligase [Clostridiales Family XIII bacterium]
MKKTGLNELRTIFRDFFVSKGHLAHKSYSLIPENDESLLLIGAGMAPLKPYFTGFATPPSKRMVTCQKCIRTGDLDNVGRTARHATFFEMLGNFSFGDYFKKESLTWGWEFVTEVLEMPVDKLWASIYEEDDEAYDIWVNDVGIDPSRVVRLGKEDNFWEIGVGPCGPCSEIYYDRGPGHGCGSPDCKPGCECDRFVEFWNHVFTQFNRDEAGNYIPLDNPNIDTGLGIERLACIMQDTDSIFDVDTIKHVLDGVVKISGVAYEDGAKPTDVSIRIITDHIRSVVFLISDGVMPSSDGRGYVLRRLLRRAAVHGRKIGIDRMFLTELADRVITISAEEYGELIEKREYIHKIITLEEERFALTIDRGGDLLSEYIADLKEDDSNVLSGGRVFKLYDEMGFSPELTKELLAEHDMDIDEDGYLEEFRIQQERSRQGRKTTDAVSWTDNDKIVSGLAGTLFTGYDALQDRARVVRILVGDKSVDAAFEGETAGIILDRTPFYAESGGQASDVGDLVGTGSFAHTSMVRKLSDVFIHQSKIESGEIRVGDELIATVEATTRNQTARNHTATHLLHKALREVIGAHVQQAGSSVNAEQLRFDFTHYEGIGDYKLKEVEVIVNRVIDEFLPVSTTEMDVDEARKKGATALFEEKYGEKVRVVEVGDFSMELCGGTHVSNSGDVGAFKIISESSIGSGVRRIEAITGTGVLQPLTEAEEILSTLGRMFKAEPGAVVGKVNDALAEIKSLRRELGEIKKAEIGSSVDSLIASADDVDGGKFVSGSFEGLTSDGLRAITDDIRATTKDVIAALASITDGKVIFIVAVSDTMQQKGYRAGDIVKAMAQAAGGGGGGKADMAQAGAKDPSKVGEAIKAARNFLKGNY